MTLHGLHFPRRYLFCLAVFILSSSERITAQQVTAGIFGRVSDPSDAPVENASVTATDTDRGTTFKVVTNQDGVILFRASRLANYDDSAPR